MASNVVWGKQISGQLIFNKLPTMKSLQVVANSWQRQNPALPIPNLKTCPTTCPQVTSPAPNWCREGKIVPQKPNACGCSLPPKCLAQPLIFHSADVNKNYTIERNELDYAISLQVAGGYHCEKEAFSGYAVGSRDYNICPKHNSDYQLKDWKIDTKELLRLIQFFNTGGYKVDPAGEDGFVPVSKASID